MGEDWPSFSRRHIREELAPDGDTRVGQEAKRVAAWEAVGFLNRLGRLAEGFLEEDPDASKTIKERHVVQAADRLNVGVEQTAREGGVGVPDVPDGSEVGSRA